jgi:fatty acid desaturase
MPTTPWSLLLHPFNDNYHLTHHLFPNVPVVRLRRLHKQLLKMPEYVRCQRIDGYFTGVFPLIYSWVDSLTEES